MPLAAVDLFGRLILDDKGFKQSVVKSANEAGASLGTTLGSRISSGLARSLGASVGTAGLVGRAFGKIETGARKMGGALQHAGGQVKGLISGPLGIVGLGAGLLSLSSFVERSVSKVTEFGREMSRMSAITGLAAGTTAGLSLVFEHYGVDADTALRTTALAEKNLGNYAGTAEKAKKFQDQYGFSLVDSTGKVKDFNTLLLDSADFFNNKAIPAQTKAAALAKIYGRNWAALVPILGAGRDALADITKEAAAAGLGSDEFVKNIADAKTATRDWNTALSVLQIEIGAQLLPLLADAAKAATRFVHDNGRQIVDFFKQGVQFAQGMGHAIEHDVVPGIQAIVGAWNRVPPEVRDLLVKGFIAGKVTKFLFDFGPLDVAKVGAGIAKSLIANTAGKLVATIAGESVVDGLAKAGIGKAFVQPVWVTNPGFGAPGVPGEAAAAGEAAGAAEGAAAGITAGAIVSAALTGAGLGALIGAIGLLITQQKDFKRWVIGGEQATAAARGLNPANVQPVEAQTGGPHASAFTGGDIRHFGDAAAAGVAKAIGSSIEQLPGKMADDLTGPLGVTADKTGSAVAKRVVPALDALHRDLQANLHTLEKSNDPAKIAAAAKRIAIDVQKGAGSVAGTQRILASLRHQLSQTHDPKLQAVLRGAIARVEAKLPNRVFVERQLAEAKRIAASTLPLAKKSDALHAIITRLRASGNTHAASIVSHILGTTRAANGTTRAVNAAKSAIVSSVGTFGTAMSGLSAQMIRAVESSGGKVKNAAGGPVAANVPSLVGEKGPEVIVPRVPGVVLPNWLLRSLAGGSRGDTYNTVVQVPVTGMPLRAETPADIARRVRQLQHVGLLEPRRRSQFRPVTG